MTLCAASWTYVSNSSLKRARRAYLFSWTSFSPHHSPTRSFLLHLVSPINRRYLLYYTFFKYKMPIHRRTFPSFTLALATPQHEATDMPDYYRSTRHETYGPYYRKSESPRDFMASPYNPLCSINLTSHTRKPLTFAEREVLNQVAPSYWYI